MYSNCSFRANFGIRDPCGWPAYRPRVAAFAFWRTHEREFRYILIFRAAAALDAGVVRRALLAFLRSHWLPCPTTHYRRGMQAITPLPVAAFNTARYPTLWRAHYDGLVTTTVSVIIYARCIQRLHRAATQRLGILRDDGATHAHTIRCRTSLFVDVNTRIVLPAAVLTPNIPVSAAAARVVTLGARHCCRAVVWAGLTVIPAVSPLFLPAYVRCTRCSLLAFVLW